MNFEIPKKFNALINQAHQVATEVFRPISRKYDVAEHEYPVELDMLASIMDGMNDGDLNGGAGAVKLKQQKNSTDNTNIDKTSIKNGSNMATILGLTELCWGDVGLALSLPRQGLGNAAIAAVANEEQLERYRHTWAAMAITEPDAGSDSASITTTATLDGDEYIVNGEKIFITAGERCDAIVVWATLNKSLGRAAIKSFVIEKGTPGMELVRLDKKLGIKASDTATIRFDNCRIPKENLLGNPEIDTQKGFGGVMQTFDNTRPVVAAMAVGLARASIELTQSLLKSSGIIADYADPINNSLACEAEIYRMEADLEAARLLTLKAAWMADNGLPNSKEASIAKAKAGRTANQVTLKCAELCSTIGYDQSHLLEKWARDSKILDIFEGTQQIQQLIVARRMLNKNSSELK